MATRRMLGRKRIPTLLGVLVAAAMMKPWLRVALLRW
jgi:hypothetical protein